MRIVIPRVDYRPHANERSQVWEYKPMRRIGFAVWDGYPRIDDPNRDDETFAQQQARLKWITDLPEDDDAEHPEM